MTEWKGSDRRSQPKQQTLKSSVDCCSSTICYIVVTRLMSVFGSCSMFGNNDRYGRYKNRYDRYLLGPMFRP
jgi:hypothetical protein